MSTNVLKPPEILDKVIDIMLAHKPKQKLKGKRDKSSSSPWASTKLKPEKKRRQ